MSRQIKTTLFFLALLLPFTRIDAQEPRQIILDISPYERTVLIIKYYESLHYGCGEYIGYGHRINPGEKYKPNQILSPAAAEKLLRKDVMKLHEKFSRYGSMSWLLTALSYNVGPYAILGSGKSPKSELLKMIESGETRERIREEYLKFCHWKGRRTKSIFRRRAMEFDLLYPPNH